MRLLMKCLFLFLNCHKPMDGLVTSAISPKTVNPSGEHYHWSIPHRSLLCWLCLPAYFWSLIYSPCLRAPKQNHTVTWEMRVWPYQPPIPPSVSMNMNAMNLSKSHILSVTLYFYPRMTDSIYNSWQTFLTVTDLSFSLHYGSNLLLWTAKLEALNSSFERAM